MDIIYKCSCMEKEVTIQVPDRREQTDIVVWMETLVLNCIAFDHSELSPNCRKQAMEYCKIPLPKSDEFIGQNRKSN